MLLVLPIIAGTEQQMHPPGKAARQPFYGLRPFMRAARRLLRLWVGMQDQLEPFGVIKKISKAQNTGTFFRPETSLGQQTTQAGPARACGSKSGDGRCIREHKAGGRQEARDVVDGCGWGRWQIFGAGRSNLTVCCVELLPLFHPPRDLACFRMGAHDPGDCVVVRDGNGLISV